MIIDGKFNLGLPTITNSTATTVSPNIYDAGSAKFVFGAGMGSYKLWFRATVTADASPTLRVSLVGSDNADGDPNDNETAGNIILADTGIITREDSDLSAMDSGDTIERVIPIQTQTVAKRYYMLLVTLGGTNPDLAASQDAYIVRDGQNNMIGARAAIPA